MTQRTPIRVDVGKSCDCPCRANEDTVAFDVYFSFFEMLLLSAESWRKIHDMCGIGVAFDPLFPNLLSRLQRRWVQLWRRAPSRNKQRGEGKT